MRKDGFSLVELSIVLVILGLLVGGILAGQSLIRASELRSVSNDMQRFTAATYAFRDKYFSIPGDMNNATAFWGKDNTNCPSHSGSAATPGTCNGNANGMIDITVSASSTGESFQFWKQLALAGMVEGTYTGLSGADGNRHSIPGTNVPRGKLANSGFSIDYLGTLSGDAWRWNGAYHNTLHIGGAVGTVPEGQIFSPPEQWNIDTKLDDGNPAQGRVRSYKQSHHTGCTTTNTESSTQYALSNSSPQCAIIAITGL